ncbi:MAG: MASE1 domain-containing protein, partial [Vulcanimicrobiaceae bacterium]
MVAFVAAWFCFDLLSSFAGALGQTTAWHFGAALTFYLLFTFGYRYAYAPLLAAAAGSFVISPLTLGTVVSRVETAGIGIIVYGAAALLLRRTLDVREPFLRLRNFFAYVVIGAAGVTTVSALLTLMHSSGTISAPAMIDFATFAIGSFVALLTVFPLLVVFITPMFSRKPFDEHDAHAPLPFYEVFIASCVLLVSAYLGYRFIDVNDSAPIYYFLFLPLVWLAARGGLRYAVAGIFLTDLALMATNAMFHLRVSESITFQAYLAASALTALTLGVIVSQRRREVREALDRARCDSVTGLPSPQALDAWFSHPRANSYSTLTLLLIEIDNIRWVNEGLHRAAIDEFMRGVGDRLRNAHVGALFLAHVSGHEFAVILDNVDRNGAALVAD